ncbi:RNase A-like domain-containing protein [Bacillus sp. Bos-x628]|uniref:RNase A-like domain-containing protein n=1 Tax=Bacillus maqinnsis TaxID=3229854 RepID=UPI00338D545B
MIINGKVYDTSEYKHIDFANAKTVEVMRDGMLYRLRISEQNKVTIESVKPISDVKTGDQPQNVLNIAVEFTGINDAIRIITGRDPVTGNKVTDTDRLVSSLYMIPGAQIVKAGKYVFKIMKGEKVAKKVSKVEKGTKDQDLIKPGDSSPLAPGGGLAAHEAKKGKKGGHLIKKHVGKTDEELFQRLKKDLRITGSSTFKDRATAEKVAHKVLTNSINQKLIKDWLDNPKSKSTLALPYKGNEMIGRGVRRDSEKVQDMTNALIILKKKKDGKFILTGYPTK